MSLGDSEYGHDRITGILFNEPIVSGHDLENFTKNPAGDIFDLFRVQLFGHGRVSGKIGEKDRYVLAFTDAWCNLPGWFVRDRGLRQAFSI